MHNIGKMKLFKSFMALMILVSTFLPSLVVPSTASAANGPEGVQLEELEGYSFGYGNIYVTNVEEENTNDYSISNDGQMNLQYVAVVDDHTYQLGLYYYYNGEGENSDLVFYDEKTLTGSELVELATWNIPEDAVYVTPDLSNLNFETINQIQYHMSSNNNNGRLYGGSPDYVKTLVTSPRTITAIYEGVTTEKDGYFFVQGFEIASNVDSIQFNPEDTVQVQLPQEAQNNVKSIGVGKEGGNFYAYAHFNIEEGINSLNVTQGNYNLDYTLDSGVSENDLPLESRWRLRDASLLANTTLNFTGLPESIDVSYFRVEDNKIDLNLTVASGDLELSSLDEVTSTGTTSVLKAEGTLTDANGKIVHQGYLTGWNDQLSWKGDFNLAEDLVSGTYDFTYALNYPKLTDDLTFTKEFEIKTQDSNDINGLLVNVKDEQGNNLENGKLTLYERIPPVTYDANYGRASFDLDVVFTNEVINGEVFVPNAYLLAGKDYELQVTGMTTTGDPIVYYHSSPETETETELLFDTPSLVTVDTEKTDAEGYLAIAPVDEKGNLKSYPYPLKLDGGKATVYTNSDTELRAEAILVNKAEDTGYGLFKQFTVEAETQTVSFDGELIELLAPEGEYDSFKMSPSGDWETDLYASKFYVTKDINSGIPDSKLYVTYVVEKDGYAYQLERGFSEFNSDIQLSFDATFEGNAYFYYMEMGDYGEIGTFYEDNQGNYLLGVDTVANVDETLSNTGISFTVAAGEKQPKTLAVDEQGDVAEVSPTPGPGGAALDQLGYDILDDQDNKVGDTTYTNDFYFTEILLPNEAGEYRLTVNQSFPTDVLQVNMEVMFHLGEVEVSDGYTINLEGPAGYSPSDYGGYSVEIWEINEDDNGEKRVVDWNYPNVQNNKLTIPDNWVDDASTYVLHITGNFYSNNSSATNDQEITYYKQVELTGEQLKATEKITLSEEGIVKLDVSVEGIPIEGHPQFRLLVGVDGVDRTESLYLYEYRSLWIAPGQYDVIASGTDNGSNTYHIKKSIDVVEDQTITFVDEANDLVKVNLVNNDQVLSFNSSIVWEENQSNGYWFGYYFPYDKRVAKNLYVTPGTYRLGFDIIDAKQGETPWGYEWETADYVTVEEDTTINFSGSIESTDFESFNQYTYSDGRTRIIFRVAAKSRDLELQRAVVYQEESNYYNSLDEISEIQSREVYADGVVTPDYVYDGEFETEKRLTATIVINNQDGEEIYKAENNGYNSLYAYTMSDLTPGNYTLNYSLPIAPREKITVQKEFVVVDENAAYVKLTQPTSEFITNETTVEVSGEAENLDAVTVSAYLGDAEEAFATKQVTPNSSNEFSTTLNLTEDGVYTIRAHETGDESVHAIPVTMTVDTTAPTKPELTVDEENEGIAITWAEDADAANYAVYGAVQGETLSLLSDQVKTNKYTFADFEPGETYEFKVEAYDAAGNSIESDVVTYTATIFVATNLDVTLDPKPERSNLLVIGTKLVIALEGAYEVDGNYGALAHVTYSAEGQIEDQTAEVVLTYNAETSLYEGEYVVTEGTVKVVNVKAHIKKDSDDVENPTDVTNELTQTLNKEVGATLIGEVTRGGNLLPADAKVTVSSRYYTATVNTVTNEDGTTTFDLGALPEGTYRVSVTYGGETYFNLVTNLELTKGEKVTIEDAIDVPAYQDVKIQVVDTEGNAITDQSLRLNIRNIEANEYFNRSGYTGEDGYVQTWSEQQVFENIPIGTYNFNVQASGIYNEVSKEITIDADTNYVENPIQLTVEKKTEEVIDVTVKFTANDDSIIETVDYWTLYSYSTASAFGYESAQHYGSNTALTDGQLTIENVIYSSDYRFYANVDGYLYYNTGNNITIDEDSNTINVELTRGVTVTGTIQGPADMDLKNLYMSGSTTSNYGYASITDNDDGTYSFTLDGLASGAEISYHVSAQDKADELTSVVKDGTITVPTGETEYVIDEVIQLEAPKYIEGYVKDAEGNFLKHAYVQVYMAKASEELGASIGRTRTGSDGYFKVYNLPAGTYDLVASKYGYPTVTEMDVETDLQEKIITLQEEGTGNFTGNGNSFTASKQTVSPGSTMKYRLDYQNNSETETAKDVVLSVTLDDNVLLTNNENKVLLNGEEAVAEFEAATSKLTVTVPSVTPGTSGSLDLEVTVASDATETIVSSAKIGEDGSTLDATTSVLFVTLNAPETTAESVIRVYGNAKAGSTVQVYAGKVLVAETTVDSRWWFADVSLPIEDAEEESTHRLVAKVVNNGNANYSIPVDVTYKPDIPKVTDVTVHAGWNGDVKLNPYTGVATFAIVEKTPLNTAIEFDQEVDWAKIKFLGETYDMTTTDNQEFAFDGNDLGNWSSYGEQLLELVFKKGEIEITLPLMEIIVLIDPSGYVFEGSMDNKLEGVTAVVEEKQDNTDWEVWDAAKFGQVNPQVTDEEGRYGWDVIAGDWKVLFSKEGYEAYTSRIVIVPPPETQLNVPMVRTTAPQVDEVKLSEGQDTIEITFDRLMNQENMSALIKVYKVDGEEETEVAGSFTLENMNGYKVDSSKIQDASQNDSNETIGWFVEDTTKKLSKNVVFAPTGEFEEGTKYKVVINGAVVDYDGKAIGVDDEKEVETAESISETPPTPGAGGGGGAIIPPVEPDATTVEKETTADGKTKVVANVDANKLAENLKEQTSVEKVSFTLETQAGEVAELRIPKAAFDVITNKNAKATIEVKTSGATFNLPVAEINLAELAKKLGTTAENVTITVAINETTDSKNVLATNNIIAKAPIIDFKVIAQAGNKQETISRFNQYLVREIVGPSNLNTTKATVVRLNDDGTFTAVPTFIQGNKATFKSFTNSKYTVIENSVSFPDVTASHWAKSDIEKLAAKFIINGMPDGKFAPTASTTRAQFAALLTRSLGLPTTDAYDGRFKDVKGNEWFAKELTAAVNAGIIEGLGDGTFAPNRAVTREQAATMIARALTIAELEASQFDQSKKLTKFTDESSIATWATSEVEKLVQAGIIDGRPDQTFAPKEDMQRAEVAKMLERYLTKAKLIN